MKKFNLTAICVISLLGLQPIALSASKDTNAFFNLVSGEYGALFTGNGDLYGRLFSAEYARTVSNKFSVGIGLHAGNFPSSGDENFSQSFRIRGLELNAYIFPLNKKTMLRGFFVAPGVHYRHWDKQYRTGPTTSAYLSDGVTMGPNSELRTSKNNTGYNIAVGYRMYFGPQLMAQIKAGVQNDADGNIVSAIRFSAGYAF